MRRDTKLIAVATGRTARCFRRSLLPDALYRFAQAYRDAVVYDGPDPADVLYEGPVIVHLNGWLELEGDRLLSPSAVHHVDVYDELDDSGDRTADEADPRGDDDFGGDDRTNRFSPR